MSIAPIESECTASTACTETVASYISFMGRYRNIVLSRSIVPDDTDEERLSYNRFCRAQDVIAVQSALNNPYKGRVCDLFYNAVKDSLYSLKIDNFDAMVENYKDTQRLPSLIKLANSVTDAVKDGFSPTDIIEFMTGMLV